MTSTRGAGQLTREPERAVDKHPLREWRTSDPRQATLRELRDAATAARQQTIKHVDCAAHQIVLTAPPAFVTPQQPLRAGILMFAQAIGDHVRERRGIEQ